MEGITNHISTVLLGKFRFCQTHKSKLVLGVDGSIHLKNLNNLHPCIDVGAGRKGGGRRGGRRGGYLLCLHHHFFCIDRHTISIENWDTNIFVG